MHDTTADQVRQPEDRLALHGRVTERAAIGELLAAARAGAGQALVLRGEAGVGKSALLDLAAATGAPMRVLRATGTEPETGLAFGGLHQLLRSETELLDLLPGPQREAVRGALGLASTRTDDRFLISAGVLSLLTEAAAAGGLLCLIDDFQWIDQASADALLFAARRLRTEGVGMLIAVRGDATASLRGVPDLHVTGLDPRSAADLLASRSAAPPARRVSEQLVALTGGNPLALGEVAELLTLEQLAGRAALPDPLPVGAGLGQIFGDQVERLSAAGRLMALVIAVEGRGDLGLILGAADRLGVDPAELHPVEAAGLVGVEGTTVRFRHPLIRSAVYTRSSSVQRRLVHTALAALLEGDADRRARHRAAASVGQDEDVAAELAASAERARSRGGYADAAVALARSAELTPEPAVRARRLTDAATAAWLGGRPGQSETYRAQARELAHDPLLIAELVQLRGRSELHSGDAAEAWRIFLEGAGHARAVDPGKALEMLADASEAASYVGDTAAIVDIGRQAESLPEGGDAFLRAVLVGIGAMLAGDTGRGGAALRQALLRAGELSAASELLWASAAASYLGEADVSAELVGRAGRVARVSGLTGQLPVVLEFVSTAERINGRFAVSAALAEEGLALAREAGYTNSAAAHLANLAAVAAVRGQEAVCREHAQEALAIAIPHRIGLRAGTASYALGLLDLGMGRFAAAHSRFSALAAAGPGAGQATVVWRSTPDRVEAAVACGDHDAARAMVSHLEQWSVNAETPASRALLARCRALLEDGGEALSLYEEALRLHDEGGPAPFEQARTSLLYGERLRRVHRSGDARQPLRSALETFQRLGAEPWAERAHSELRAAGETVSRPGPAALSALTPQELRIARLVAEGASNRDVAAKLFLSPRTVEYHLYKVYPKLGVTTRTELARLVGADPDSGGAPPTGAR
ncbi:MULTISPECIES: helix-turn-helix transcriptional regulator [Streptosporangium]|uniref:DNA-binding CsgD family transcriptional regulator n=1 Tax=Streptosporangium brasiliense TaxID=47480 RepID=A0ABT9RE77_9ACTN|nr:LuxR family transcriptional regulator [Streptosporangium brasiliense]MDP9867571.1 DNA-binding CsgD family transcriptional regulator [Streptosporangium brasiliense]